MTALLHAEWLRLCRAPVALLTLLFFALLMVVLLYFSLPMEMGEAARRAPYFMWLVVFLGGILQCNRSFDAERDEDVLDGLRLIPGLLPKVFLAKCVVNLVLLTVLLAAVVGMVIVFLNYPATEVTLALVLPSALGLIGLTAVGTFFAAMVRGHHQRDLILPVLLFPIVAPLALSVVRWYAALQAGEGLWETPWGHLVIAFDLIFGAACWMLFPVIVEE